MRVMFVGDIHRRFEDLNTLINKKSPEILIQLGDNAYFWVGKNSKGEIKPNNTKVYLLPGNHEDWMLFDSVVSRRGRNPIEVEKNIFYCPIGSTLTINNKTIMFIGGADSIDKDMRTLGIDWFPQELINQEDIDYCLSIPNKIDIICSHTCPKLFDLSSVIYGYDQASDPSMKALDIILEQLKPSEWYFGHWHCYLQGKIAGCRWWCLNMAVNTKWWINRII